ncbi:MmgE/PrpD family protein, partial [Rhizobium ruizarguesonis]
LGSRVPGSVELPMTLDELFHKFCSCARAAVSPLSADRIFDLFNSLKALESIRDVREIVSAAVSNIDVQL